MLKETLFFLASVVYGVQLSLIYDLIRGIRRTWCHKKILIAIEDVNLGIAAGVFLFVRVFHWNDGILRWYFFLGLGLGILLYHVTISLYVLEIVCFLLKWLKMCFSWFNILGKGVVTRILNVLGIKNGENGKEEKAQSAKQGNETE